MNAFINIYLSINLGHYMVGDIIYKKKKKYALSGFYFFLKDKGNWPKDD